MIFPLPCSSCGGPLLQQPCHIAAKRLAVPSSLGNERAIGNSCYLGPSQCLNCWVIWKTFLAHSGSRTDFILYGYLCYTGLGHSNFQQLATIPSTIPSNKILQARSPLWQGSCNLATCLPTLSHSIRLCKRKFPLQNRKILQSDALKSACIFEVQPHPRHPLWTTKIDSSHTLPRYPGQTICCKSADAGIPPGHWQGLWGPRAFRGSRPMASSLGAIGGHSVNWWAKSLEGVSRSLPPQRSFWIRKWDVSNPRGCGRVCEHHEQPTKFRFSKVYIKPKLSAGHSTLPTMGGQNQSRHKIPSSWYFFFFRLIPNARWFLFSHFSCEETPWMSRKVLVWNHIILYMAMRSTAHSLQQTCSNMSKCAS